MAGAKALWKRLPTYFPNIKLVLYPLTRDEMLQLNKTGDLTQARFRTNVDVGKLQIREFLEKVYNLPVLSVDTAIIYGKKRSVESGKTRKLTKNPDYKKVWVKFAPGRLFPGAPPASE